MVGSFGNPNLNSITFLEKNGREILVKEDDQLSRSNKKIKGLKQREKVIDELMEECKEAKDKQV